MSTSLCQICFENPAKYKCPACSTSTCCLECVKAHKLEKNCDGQIDTTKYVSSSQIKENAEILLQRDYNFLVNFGRKVDVGKSDTYKVAKPIFQKPRSRQRSQQNIINKGSVKVIKMPIGMQRSKMNKTFYDKQKKKYFWTVEIVQLDAGGSETKVKTEPRVPEDTALLGYFEPYTSPESLVYLRVYSGDTPYLKKVSLDQTLSEALANCVLLEYPTFYISNGEPSSRFKLWNESDSESDSDGDTDGDNGAGSALDTVNGTGTSAKEEEKLSDSTETSAAVPLTDPAAAKSTENEPNATGTVGDSGMNLMKPVVSERPKTESMLGISYESDSENESSPEEADATQI